MKKILFLVGITVLNTLAHAQQTSFGIKGGYSLSILKGDLDFSNALSYESKPLHSFYAGGFVEQKVNDKFALQGEILYSLLGGTEIYEHTFTENLNSVYNETLKLHSLQIPISGKYLITDELAVTTGLNLGLILSAQITYVDVTDNTKSFVVSPFIGAEYSLNAKIFVDARYNFGVADLTKYNRNLRNSFLQAGVGYRFGGGQYDSIVMNR